MVEKTRIEEEKIHQIKENIKELATEQSSVLTGTITLIITVTAVLISIDAFLGSALINLNLVVTLLCLGYISYSAYRLYTWVVFFLEYRAFHWDVLVFLNKLKHDEGEEIPVIQNKVPYFNKKAKELGVSFRNLVFAHVVLFSAIFIYILIIIVLELF